MAAGIKIIDTTSPCTVEDRAPKVCENCDMVVMGPIVPVSSLQSSAPITLITTLIMEYEIRTQTKHRRRKQA